MNKLLADLCPDGVRRIPLGELGKFIRGNGIQKANLRDSGVGAIHYGQIHTYYGTAATEVLSFVDEELARRSRKAFPGDLVIATTSEDDEAVGKAVAWIGEEQVAISGDAFIFRHALEPKYVSYFFQTDDFQSQKKRHITGTKVRRISGESLAKIIIPLPPLPVQREIVAILDTFTELEAELETELETELEARKHQYAYYRDALLRLDGKSGIKWIDDLCPDGVERKMLGDVAVFRRGTSMTRKDIGDGQIPVIAGGRTPAYYHDKSNRTGETIVVAGSGAYAGFVTFWTTPIFVSDAFSVHPDADLFLPKYVYYFLLARQSDIHEKKRGGGVPHVKGNDLSPFIIPIPPLEVQREIVNVLDKFDALVNDLSIGLPAELAARRKQYEYYRNQLLTFKEAI
jgi:type I restriction enzyme S subunit